MILTNTSSLDFYPKRIVSLVPSQTELLDHLGLETETIGITKFCVHPPSWKKNKQIIGGTKTVNIEKIIALTPDLIIANKEENVKEQIEELAARFPVWVTDVNNLTDAYQMIKDVGILTNREKKSAELIDQIKIGFHELSAASKKINTCYLIWKDPYMTVGGDTFISDMMEKAGCVNVFSTSTRYPEISINQIKKSNCELILLSSEPYPFSDKHIEALQAEIPYIRILLADGEMFSWYGSHLLQSAPYFKKLLTPHN